MRYLVGICISLLLTLTTNTYIHAETKVEPEKIKVGFYVVPQCTNPNDVNIERERFFHILKEIENISNYSLEFVLYDAAGGLKALENGEIDIFGPIRDTKERRQHLAYMKKPLDRAHISLAFSGNKNIFYNDLSSVQGKTIANFEGSGYDEMLKTFLKKRNIDANFVYGPELTYHQLDADFHLTVSKNENFKDFYSVYNFSVDNYYFVANKGKKYLIDDLDALYERAIAENGALLENLYAEQQNHNTTQRYLTKEEMLKLKQATFHVGYTKDHQPIQYTNKKGQPDGISVEIINLLAEQYGFKVVYHGYDPEKPGDRKDYDILISSQDVIPDLYDKYIPTNAYLELPLVIFANKKFLHLANAEKQLKNIGMYNYIGFDVTEFKEKLSNPNIYYFNSIKDAGKAYFGGELDAALFTITGAEYITSLVGEANMRMIPTEFTLPLRFYVSKKLPYDYVEIFNLLFSHLDKGRTNLFVSKQTVSFTPELSMLKIINDYKGTLITLLLLIIVFIGGFIWHGKRKEKQAVLNALNHDELTGLPSYYYFIQQCTLALQNANELEYELISLDIDHYSLVSKFHGYQKSTDAILLMADTLLQRFNKKTDIICRISAEQFIILHKRNTSDNLEEFFDNIFAPAIKTIIGEKFCLSLSVGICTIKNPNEAMPIFIDRANLARVKGKHLHKNTYNYFDNALQAKYERQALIVSQMEKAIEEKKFYLCYQPKVDLDSLKIHGAEALVRWNHIDGTTIFPDEFITTFESNGFIETLDLYVFESVCELLAKHAKTINIPVISINLSTYTIKNPETPQALKNMLDKYKLTPRQIEIEIAESALVDDTCILLEQVDSLKSVGFNVSLDDFGSGVSTLNRLASVNVDIVKLDKLFLDFNITEKKGSIVVENIIRLTKDLQMQVVCEGVETAQQVRWLKSLKCNLVQGYFFDKPLSEHDFLKILKENKTYSID